ncbi:MULTISPECIES: CBM96 family carbohydrate-binding protein [Paenibacillus]|uniref:CBM96 family carbohydrate-binding protein n=1 Tax=Paenibacillus TaxID=44249 RepID=UPI0022B8B1C1|nr:DNRLRE domain-containing protein [Paenibacillus caseinilyticus]
MTQRSNPLLPSLLTVSLLASLMPSSVFGSGSTSAEIIVDDLKDWSRSYKHAGTLGLQVAADADDSTRIKKSAAFSEYIVYRTENSPLQSFTVYAYYNPSYKPYDHPIFFASSDGVKYTKIVPESYDNGGNLNLMVYESTGLPADTRYLKIQYSSAVLAKAPSIGKVVLNGPAAVRSSLPAGLVPEGSYAALSTATPGATIYYTTDGSDPSASPTRRKYESPLPVADYLSIKAAAEVTGPDGLPVPGSVSTYRYAGQSAEKPVIPAKEDAFVDSGAAAANYGTSVSLQAKSSRDRHTYLKFDLTNFSEDAQSVTLNVYASTNDTVRTPALIQVYPVAGSWTESTLKYSNKPLNRSTVQPLAEQTLEMGPAGWLQFDVTAYAREQKALGRTEMSLALVNASDRMTTFSSRETGALAPFLKVTPAQRPAGIVDELADFTRLANRANIRIEGADSGYFGGDTKRMTRNTTSPGYVLYKLDEGIRSFTVYSYFYTGIPIEPHRMYASADGKSFTEVGVTAYPVGKAVSNWQQYAYEAWGLPAGTRYLKVELLGTTKAWSPQMSKVTMNQHTASVALETSSGTGAMNVTLTSPATPAKIFYRSDASAEFQPYTGPIVLSGYKEVEAYAVKNGYEKSPVRSFTVNASTNIQVDKYGQMVSAGFSSKVSSDAELKADASADELYYGSLQEPQNRDSYGGLAGSAAQYGLEASGFFKIQEADGRKVMTTPEGNVYFSLGMNGITPNETYTMVAGREDQYEWLPSYTGEYKPAFILSKDNFSFYLANKYRKTGKFPSGSSFYSEAVSRIKKWGFNGAGAWAPTNYAQENNFPYTAMLPLSGMAWAKVPGISIFDIYAPNAEALMDKAFASMLPAQKNDPLLIGYFIDNEYDYHMFNAAVPKLKASTAAIKGRLVQFLQEKYGTVSAFNASWGTKFMSFEELKEAELTAKTGVPTADMDNFFKLYLDTFYGTVNKLFRKYDSNHLLLGDRWLTTPSQNVKVRGFLAAASGKYVDVISINHYSYALDKTMMNDVYAKSGGRPILLSEFSFGTAEQGLKAIVTGSALDENDRQLRYRSYVESAASLGYVVGAHWFNYVDQAGTGRYWSGLYGERYNSGLLNVADRPYKQLLAGITQTNHEIYDVLLGARAPFFFDFNQPR